MLKQRAFYVDFVNGIIDPASITASDYTNALHYVMLFRNDISEMIAKIERSTDAELQLLVEELQLFEIDRLRQQTYKAAKEIKKVKDD